MSTIKIAHASDLHCSERHRLDDWRRLHRTMVEQMDVAGVELILLAGDLFHARSTPAERNAMAEFLIGCAELAPVVISKGNHDAAEDLDVFGCLAARCPIRVMDRPGVERIETRGGEVAVICLPWYDKAQLVAAYGPEHDSQATTNATIEAARHLLIVLRGWSTQARQEGRIPILCGHVMLGGSVVSTGQVLIGQGVELSPSDILDVGAEYAALGHIHKAQEWFGGKVAYSGSTWRQNFGEAEPKGWRLVTLEDGKFADAEFIELPARKIVLLEESDGAAIDPNNFIRHGIDGALVRLRYHVRAHDLDQLGPQWQRAMEATLLRAGAAEVKLEAVLIQEVRQRAPQIASARTTWEKVGAWLEAKGLELEAAGRERLRRDLAIIEGPEQGTEVPAEVPDEAA